MEPRQFIYIDDEVVRSLLASHSIAAPETVKEKTEQISEGDKGVDFGVGLDIPYVGNAEIGAEGSSSKMDRGVFEASRKVNEQYLFNILYEAFEEGDHIVDYTQAISENEFKSLSEGDLVKIWGEGRVDVIYRLFTVLDFLFRVDGNEEKIEEIEEYREIAYGDEIGFSVNVEDTQFSFGMVLDESCLWIENKRKLMQNHNYVVMGRVREMIGQNEKWDYPDIMRLGDTVLSDQTMDIGRGMINDLLDSVKNFESTVDLPDFGSTSLEEMDEEDWDVTEEIVQMDINHDEITLKGPGFVIDPIAIYW